MRVRDEDLQGYTVVDVQGRDLGPATAFWLDSWSARPAFAAVRTEDGERIVPLHDASLDEQRRVLRVPYTRELVRGAPTHPAREPIPGERKAAILRHFEQAPRDVRLGEDASLPTEIPLHRERATVGKRVVQGGGVRLRKVTRTKTVNVPVEIRYEEIVVEHVDAAGAPREALQDHLPATPFEEGSIFIPEFREEPVITKRTEIAGGVRASKTAETAEELVDAPTRREEVHVDRFRSQEDRID